MKEIDVAPWFYGFVFLYAAITGVWIWWRRVGGQLSIMGHIRGDDAVNNFQEDSAAPDSGDTLYVEQTEQTDKTDSTDRPVSEADQWMDRLEVDKTRAALIELMVYSGWTVGEVRNVVKGDNGTIGAEVESARKRLGIAPDPPRMLTVRDEHGARVIPFRETEPGLRYEAPPR